MRDDDAFVATPPSRIAAWRRPGLVAVYFLYRSLTAMVLATPFVAVAQQLTGGYPRGDAMLLDRGGVMLLEAVRLAQPLLGAMAAQTSALALAVAVFGLVPMAALVVGLGREGRLRLGPLMGRATDRLGALGLLFGVAALLEVVVASAFVLLGESLVSRLRWVEPQADQLRAASWVVGVIAVLWVGVLHDLARVAAVHRGLGFYGASVAALRVLRHAGLRAMGAYALRALQSVAALASAAMIVGSLRAEAPGALAAAWVLHQAALLLAVICRASWLAAALRLLETTLPSQPEELDPAELLEFEVEPPRGPLATMEVRSSELIYSSDRPPPPSGKGG